MEATTESKYKHFTEKEAIQFFARLFGGEHHLPGKIKQHGHGFSINAYGDMSTFDFNRLTRFVLMCHRECVRGTIEQGGPGRIKLIIWRRRGREGSLYDRHPTIEQAIESFNENYTPMFPEAIDATTLNQTKKEGV